MIPQGILAGQIEAAEEQAHLENTFGSLYGFRVDSRPIDTSLHAEPGIFSVGIEKGIANVTALVASGVEMAFVELGPGNDPASVVVHGTSLTDEVVSAHRGVVVTIDVSGMFEVRDPSIDSFMKVDSGLGHMGSFASRSFLFSQDKARKNVRTHGVYSFADKLKRPGTDSVFKLRATGQVKALLKLRELWKLDNDQMNVLLGYRAQTGKASTTVRNPWCDVAELRAPLDNSVDRVDRVRMLTMIDGLLYGLYGDAEGPRKWLRHTVAEFDATPLDFMLQGSLRRLYVVVDYLQGLTDPAPQPRQT